MSWNDRIREAAYTSPGGIRQTFGYENVSKTIAKKTAEFNFPDADGTYVQDLGRTSNKFNLRLFFSGGECDLQAEAFEALLLERGTGRLEHPMYGIFDVVPFGDINRRDDLKTAANQTVLEVSFFETTGLIYPSPSTDPGTQVLKTIDEYNEAAAEEFEDTIALDTELQKVTLKEKILSAVAAVKDGLQAVADFQDNVKKQFDAIVASVNGGIDLLIAEPLSLANQMVQLAQAPARALSSIRARLDGYRNLFDDLIGAGDSTDGNDLRTNDLSASSYVSGQIISAVNTEFTTKTEALNVALELLETLDDLITWRDGQFAIQSAVDTGLNDPVVDTGGAFQKISEAVALAAGYLVEISFSLKQEKRVTLDRPRTMIDFVAEVYGSIDENLDFFITSNELTGDEILELPAGREVKYYV